MDPIHAAYLLSFACAVTFFVAGLALGRPKRKESEELQSLRSQVAQLEAARDKLARQSQAEQELASGLSVELAVTTASAHQTRAELDSVKERLAQEEQQVQSLSNLRVALEKELSESVSRLAVAKPISPTGADGNPQKRVEADLAETKRRLSRELVLRAKQDNQLAEANRLASEEATRRSQLEAELAQTKVEVGKIQAELATAQQHTRTQEGIWTAKVEEERARARSSEQRLAIVTHNLGDRETQLQAIEARLRAELESTRKQLSDLTAPQQQQSQELANLKLERERLQKIKQDQERTIHELEATHKDLRHKLVVAESRADPAPDPELTEELERANRNLKQLKVDQEHMASRIQELEAERATHVDLKERLQDLTNQAAEAHRLRKELSAVSAELYALGGDRKSSATLPVSETVLTGDTAEALAALLATDSARSAVLADRHGLLVAAAGDSIPHEGLAALTGLAHHIADQATQLLPLGEIRNINLHDANQLVVSCRLFVCGSEAMAIAVLGTEEPAHHLLDRAVLDVGGALGLSNETSAAQ